jgi:hypothetical protein
VPRVVQPGLTYTGLTEQRFPLVVVGVRIERATVRPCEYPSFAMPELAGGRALGFLLPWYLARTLASCGQFFSA